MAYCSCSGAVAAIALALHLIGCGGALVPYDLSPGDGGDASVAVAPDATSESSAEAGQPETGLDPGTCSAGAVCEPGHCAVGHYECDGGTAHCAITGNVADGTPCGEAQVCHQGTCVGCAAGADCTAPNSCHKMANDCSSGVAVCAPAGNVNNGTACGVNAFCNDGACASCTAGADCAPPNRPCNAGKVACAQGQATCDDQGVPSGDGRACGVNMVCYQGACMPCSANLSCTPLAPSNVCDKGLTACSTGVSICKDQLTPDPAQDTKPCGASQICSGGACVVCGPSSCPNGCCDSAGQCVTTISANACGAKGGQCRVCGNLPNVSGPTSCLAGQCSVPATSCARGWAHCSTNPNDGCETDITKPANCGMCRNVCAAASAPVCCVGKCADTQSDGKNCGVCGDACGTGQTCLRGKCSCTMVGYWPADGDARDAVGQNEGQLNGATFVPGVSGRAFSFDGMSSVTVLRPPLRASGDFTYALWINVGTYANGSLGAGDGSYFLDRTSATNPLVSLKPVGDMYALQIRYDDGTGLGGPVGGAIVRNTWTHVAMVRKAANHFALYVGGKLAASVPDAGGLLDAPPFKLGRHESLAGFVGLIDDFRIYDYALVPAQIQELASGQECK